MNDEARDPDHRASAASQERLARDWGPRWLRRLFVALGTTYLALIFLDVFISGPLYRWVPGPLLYLSQVSGLFTSAKVNDTEYRVEGWDCASSSFREIDVRPLFPILADDKENRLHRAVYFFRGHVQVLRALDRYLTNGYNVRIAGPGTHIGGVRISAARTPIPAPGEPVRRYRRKTLADYPPGTIQPIYATNRSERVARCERGE